MIYLQLKGYHVYPFMDFLDNYKLCAFYITMSIITLVIEKIWIKTIMTTHKFFKHVLKNE